MFDPIFVARRENGSLVEISPTAMGSLSVSVTDHSSKLREPQRLWGFIDVSQATNLRNALDAWLKEGK